MSISVAILGATGVVGQKAIALLQGLPEFKITELVASEQRIGSKYKDVADWREPLMPMPQAIGEMTLKAAQEVTAEFVVSCLPSDTAEHIEPMLAQKGKIIFSNASAFRMHPYVPLLVPEINKDHLCLLEGQSSQGKIITNPNCAAVGATLAIAPLMSLGAIKHISIVTLQSSSGAGYPGVPSMDLLSNTIPHIEGEADKIVAEVKRILGTPTQRADFDVTAHVHRVPVLYGHTVKLHMHFDRDVTIPQATGCYQQWNQQFPDLFQLHERLGRPQPAKDLRHDDYRIHIGHLSAHKNVLGLVSLSHNLVRGAAGAVIMNMLAYLKGR